MKFHTDMRATATVKRVMYKGMTLEGYLKAVSRMFFVIYDTGFSRFFATYEYPRFLKRLVRPGDVIIDIGANLGYYSRFFSRLSGKTGKVYAVEPVKPILGVLKRNLHKCGNVEIYNYALGSENKTITMGNDSVRGAEHFATGRNFVLDKENTGREEAVNEFDSEMRRGSELFGNLDRLDMIKCDIEGYEGVVIFEMEPVIDSHMPLVLIETVGENRTKITSFFEDKGYYGFILEKGRMRPAAPSDIKDLIFVPQTRMRELKLFVKR